MTSSPVPCAGLFCGSPVQPTVRLGVGVVGLLITFVERSTSAETRAGQARFMATHMTHLAPPPLAGLLFGDPSPFRWLPADAPAD